MNRFFSKLKLEDIKIKPEGNRFPPDADEESDLLESSAQATETVDVQSEQPAETFTESWPSVGNGFTPDGDHAPFQSNGHYAEQGAVDAPPTQDAPVSNPAAFEPDGEFAGVCGDVLKVSARSRPSAVAGAIAGVVRDVGRAEVQAIGAGATNQAVKAVAIARDYLGQTGIDAICVPAFIDVTIENEDRTAIRLVIEPRHGAEA